VIDSASMSRWKELAPLGLIACAILLLLVSIVEKFASRRSPATPVASWNSGAIAATWAGIRVREVDSTHAAVAFLYDLDNQTDTDYRLAKGPDVVIMDRLEAGGTLRSDERAGLESTAFIPARNRTRIALEFADSFRWPAQKDAAANREFNQLVAGDLGGLLGFVLFDQTGRYQIELPAASPDVQQTPIKR
jgi:hypothetical protein